MLSSGKFPGIQHSEHGESLKSRIQVHTLPKHPHITKPTNTHTHTLQNNFSNQYSEIVHSFLTANNFNILTKDPTEKFHNLIHKTMQKKVT